MKPYLKTCQRPGASRHYHRTADGPRPQRVELKRDPGHFQGAAASAAAATGDRSRAGGGSLKMRPQRPNRIWFVLWLSVLCVGPLPAAWVYESTNEFFSSADFDGDGRLDLVIADKATGDYRLGYQQTGGQLTWGSPRASGIEDLTGFSVARFFNSSREAMAFTAPAANRVNLLEASSSTNAGLPVTATFGTSGRELGPNLVVGLDIAGSANTALHDLLIGTTLNSPPNPHRLVLVRNNSASIFADLGYFNVSGALEHGNAVTLKTGTPVRAGVILPARGSSSFFALDPSGGTITAPLLTTNLPLHANYVAANFNASPLVQFLFYAAGRSNLWRYPLSERTPGALEFGASNAFILPDPVRQVVLLPGATDTKLLIIFGAGTNASVYNFDGGSTPSVVHSFTAQPGESFTGAGALAGNSFVMFSGRDGANTSTFFQTWNFNGSTYTAGQSGALPAIHRLTATANVFFFNREPFVSSAPILLRSVNARDWSSLLAGLPGSATVQAESFSNPSNGLQNPVSVTLGAAPATTTAGLVNQYRETIALFGHGPANGDTPGDLTFAPEPGSFTNGVTVVLTNSAPATIYHRSDTAGAWQIYTTPIRLFKTTTLSAYAEASGSAAHKSRIKSATYTITAPPGELDSDGDGVPDYVELARGTDPTRADSDLDGYSDFDELLKGASPPNTNTTEKHATFDLRARPRAYNGASMQVIFAASNTPVRLHDLAGSLLAAGSVVMPFPQSYAPLLNVSAEQSRRLLALSTEANFQVRVPLNADYGRELIGILPVPEPPPIVLSNTYTGMNDAADADAWVIANSNLFRLSSRPLYTHDVSVADTLAAAVIERAIRQMLLARGDAQATNLTLFPARAPDADRYTPGLTPLLSLEFFSNNLPAYSLPAVALTISNRVFSAEPDIAALRALTTNIYRISSVSNQVAITNMAATNVVYPLPFDVLRQFFDTGLIHSNYLAARSLSPEEFSAAQQAAALRALTNILASIQPRPATNLTLQVRADTYSAPCTLLDSTDGAATFALFNPQRARYRLLESFHLVPGSHVRVSGFLDAPTNACNATSLEVVSIDLVSVPSVADADTNGNGLSDSWEALYGLSDPNGDADGDGLSNLQEMQAGTDPRDSTSHAILTIADAGPGSLRQAILHANSTPGPDFIRFNIPGGGVKTIAPLTPLPAITAPLTLDGYSQPGARPNTLPVGNDATLLIELSGQNIAGPANGLGIGSTSNCLVRGLCLNRWTGHAIFLAQGENHHIAGNLLGTDATGSLVRGNGESGIFVSGTRRALIGGTMPADRNVISANRIGVLIVGGDATGNVIEGNLIGLDAAGLNAVANQEGVNVVSSSSNRIGGTSARARNLISGNAAYGVLLNGGARANEIFGNYIGTRADGLTAVGNGLAGVAMDAAPGNFIGGASAGQGNLISGNGIGPNAIGGVYLLQPASQNNLIVGNRIGTDSTGLIPLGNHSIGVIINGAISNRIGGSTASEANIVAFNTGVGVLVYGATATGNAIQGNSIYANRSPGILLEPGGETNDAGDQDTGPNQLQNFPLLTAALTEFSGTTLTGTLNSQPNRTYRLEFFASTAADPGGSGAGQRFLGWTNAATDGAGVASFQFQSATRVFDGEFFTATATDSNGNTSQFSPSLPNDFRAATLPALAGDDLWLPSRGTIGPTIPTATPGDLPRLAIRREGNQVILNWPNSSIGYQLQQASSTVWTEVLQIPAVVRGSKEVTLPINTPYRFFRLRKP